MTIILIGLFVFGVFTRRFMQAFEVETWHLSIGFLALAGILYALNVVRRSVVRPKTSLGLLSISSLIAAVFPWWFAFSNNAFGVFLALMVLFFLVALVGIARTIRKGGGSMTTMMLGATDEFYGKDQKEAVETILEQQMGDRLEEQMSGDPEDDRGGQASPRERTHGQRDLPDDGHL